ncbi:uncharacterized protein Dana_GF13572, isoform C [Drosophila ananassae]|uniref:Dystroglycan 1 n=1 Tax=Drosophila ananassae TaxID=7217 RepID=A0A0N8P0F5_DROAN|nr:dystroglycan isoform X9 [Drosophila ananassae]KPU76980.1 uncharacterized protein Dana_GF13572, isoform C [Drosophila ananassae]
MDMSRSLSAGGNLMLLPLCLLLATFHGASVLAERDFNVNDSQVPVIEPKDVPAYKQDPYVKELMGCSNSQSEVVLSLVLKKHDWSDLTATKRAHVQAKLAKFFAIPKEFISLDSVSKLELKSMHKLANKRGGKGNKNVETLNRRLGRASFMIGCDSRYFAMGEPIAMQIAHQVKDGTIGALTEENFGLWFIWRKELKARSHRKKRQSEGSGNDDDDYEYEDDPEDTSEPSTEVPAVTTHAHRHHHGASEVPDSVSVTSVASEEEIQESVSMLESVISKTIENTKNIKELPILGADAEDEEDEEFLLPRGTAPSSSTMATLVTEAVKPVLFLEENQVDQGAVDVEIETSTPTPSPPAAHKPYSPYDATSSVGVTSPTPVQPENSEPPPSETSPSSATTPTPTPTPMLTELESNAPTTSTSISIASQSPANPAFLSPSSQATQASLKTTTTTTLTSTTATISTTTATTTLSESPKQSTPTVASGTTTTTALPESSSSFASTDYVEPPAEENSPPVIETRLPKFAVTSGKAFTFVVPRETFADAEDQGNLRLDFTDKDGHELKSTSWLQFNVDKRELYGLPLDDTVSRWQYRLTATDSGNASVTETVEISVQQHRAVRTINHEISISVRINEIHGHNINWQLKLINAVARTLDDATSSALVVREIRQTVQDPYSATLVYFNETLPTNECPEKELNDLVARLDAQRLSDLVQPLLAIKSITGQLIGSCQKELTRVKPTQHMAKNVPPMPRNQVDRVNASVGQLLVYKVPTDTFYDANDQQLTLTLKTKDHKELSTRHWLQFDSKNEEFYGVPKSGDIGSEEYLLVAEDSGGLVAHDALVVVVSHAPKREFGAFFKAYLAIRHENFNADLQRKFVERVARLHGDPTTTQIQIRSVTTHHDSDGTIVNFYNTTLYKMNNRCPEKELAATRSIYLNSDLSLKDSVKRALGPELNLTNFSVVPFGSCHHAEIPDIQPDYNPRPDEPSLKSTFSDEYLANIVLPAVIIVVMIILASLVACCLHRRRHKSGKMELGDDEERKSFRAKGIPVIFQDEYEEKPEIGNKSPVILKDEKPPLLPPSYNTSNMNGDNDVDEYVPPPAVVVGGREVRGKSPATPSYRKPPPYVSP